MPNGDRRGLVAERGVYSVIMDVSVEADGEKGGELVTRATFVGKSPTRKGECPPDFANVLTGSHPFLCAVFKSPLYPRAPS